MSGGAVALGAEASTSTTTATTEPTPPAPAPAPAQGVSPGMLTSSEWTRRLVAAVIVATLCVSVLFCVFVMGIRVLQDGNSPVVLDFSGKLSIIAVAGIAAMVTALFGSNSVLSKLLDKVL